MHQQNLLRYCFFCKCFIMTDIYYKETKCLRENCLFYIGAGIRYRKYRESSARALAWSLFKPKATSYMIKCNNLVRHCLLKIYLFQPILCCEPGCWFPWWWWWWRGWGGPTCRAGNTGFSWLFSSEAFLIFTPRAGAEFGSGNWGSRSWIDIARLRNTA